MTALLVPALTEIAKKTRKVFPGCMHKINVMVMKALYLCKAFIVGKYSDGTLIRTLIYEIRNIHKNISSERRKPKISLWSISQGKLFSSKTN